MALHPYNHLIPSIWPITFLSLLTEKTEHVDLDVADDSAPDRNVVWGNLFTVLHFLFCSMVALLF